MIVRGAYTLAGAREAEGLCVVIDVFRACSTACAIAAQGPASYIVVADDDEAALLRASTGAVLVGKPDIGSALAYDVPNSPILVEGMALSGRSIVHKSAAGTRGVLAASSASEVILGAFVNARAVATYVLARQPSRVSLVSLGHRGILRSDEDEACAAYIAGLLEGRDEVPVDLARTLRRTSGRYFFQGAEQEYPRRDFEFCLERSRFDFVVRANRQAHYAVLEAIPVPGTSSVCA